VLRGGWGLRRGGRVLGGSFAIDPPRRVAAAIHSEVNMNTHADRALAALS
jgi:hypothetical protein